MSERPNDPPGPAPTRPPAQARSRRAAATSRRTSRRAASRGRRRSPSWLRVPMPGGERYQRVRETLRGLALHTVCQEASCPNVGECWGGGTATVMLMGDVCTRGCRFCHVKTAARPPPLDRDEPRHLAEAVAGLGLDYIVVTSVDRDDLPDGGAGHFADAIRAAEARSPGSSSRCSRRTSRATPRRSAPSGARSPDVFANNIETVRRLTPVVRDARAGYDQTLGGARPDEGGVPGRRDEVLHHGRARRDGRRGRRDDARPARAWASEILTLGQYLRPSAWHLPVVEWVTPAAVRGATGRPGARSGSGTSRAVRWCARATGRRSCSCGGTSRRGQGGNDFEPERGMRREHEVGGRREGARAATARERRRAVPEGVPPPPDRGRGRHRRRRRRRDRALRRGGARALPVDGPEPHPRRADDLAPAAGAHRLLHRVRRGGGDRLRRRCRRWPKGTGSSRATASTAPRCSAACRSRRSSATSSATRATS